MRKLFFLVVCSLFLLVSCDKLFLDVEGSEADLQGKWQMDGVDTVYYNFQKSLFQYQIYRQKDKMTSIYGYYFLHGDTVIDLKLFKKDIPSSLTVSGWDDADDDMKSKSFRISKLTNKKLILSADDEMISFRKF
ncbi:MAG: lipocalin-like domain-containing protein [Dysgonamonadaceae bacterium]|jgi:hypothetical protein|nr:lipocalin-like domain-containing protein [Dysgonamonadaceae bacterium]